MKRIENNMIRRLEEDPYFDPQPVLMCPECGVVLEYYKGVEATRDYLYCPKCVNIMYDPDTREKIGDLT